MRGILRALWAIVAFLVSLAVIYGGVGLPLVLGVQCMGDDNKGPGCLIFFLVMLCASLGWLVFLFVGGRNKVERGVFRVFGLNPDGPE